MEEKNIDLGHIALNDESRWFEYLGDWSTLRRKNISATLLALATVRSKISKPTTIVSDIFLHGFFHSSDVQMLEKRKEKCRHIRAFLRQTDFKTFRLIQQEHLKKSLTPHQIGMQNELWYNTLDIKGKISFPWVYPQSRLNVVTSKTTKNELEQMKTPPKFTYILPGYDKDEKTEDEKKIGFSVDRVGRKGSEKKQLFRPTGIAVFNTEHMNTNFLRCHKGFICKLIIVDSGNDRVQLWTYQCLPYFPKTLEETGGFEETVTFEKLLGGSAAAPTDEVRKALNEMEFDESVNKNLQMNSPNTLKHVAREEKNYNIIQKWQRNNRQLQKTHGYQKGQFSSPQYVSIDNKGCIHISDNNSRQIGSPRLQIFAPTNNFSVPCECIDNNTNVLGITRKQAKLYLDEDGNPLRREDKDTFFHLSVDGKSSRERQYSNYLEVGAKISGVQVKGIAWSFPRAKRPFELEEVLTQNLSYTTHEKIKEAFDRLNNEGKQYNVGEIRKTMEIKTQLLQQFVDSNMLYGAWLVPNEITVVNQEVFDANMVQSGNSEAPFIYYITSLSPGIAEKVFMKAFRSSKEHKDENGSENYSEAYTMNITNHEGCRVNMIVEVEPIAQFNGKAFLKIICVVERDNMDTAPDDTRAMRSNSAKKKTRRNAK